MKWQLLLILVLSFFQSSTEQNLIANGNFDEVKDGFPLAWKAVVGRSKKPKSRDFDFRKQLMASNYE